MVLKGIAEMTIRLQQFSAEWQMDSADYRNTKLVTLLSKLVMALVTGIVVMLIFLMS